MPSSPTPADPTSERPADPKALSRRWQARRRLRRRIALGLAAVLVVGGYFAARPGWRMVKRMRAHTFAATAERLVRAGDEAQALDRARAALRLDAESSRALRVAATVLSETDAPRALWFWRRLAATPDAGIEDRLAYTELALSLGLPAAVSNEVTVLLAQKPPTPRALRIGAHFRALTGDIEAAIELGRELLRVERDNPTNVLGLATVLLNRRDTTSQAEARELLWRVAAEEGASRSAALELLARGPTAGADVWARISAEFATRPPRSMRERVLAIEAESRNRPGATPAEIGTALVGLRPQTEEEVASVVAGLHRHQRFEEALGLLTLRWVESSQVLFLARVRCLADAGRVSEAYALLLNPPRADPFEPLDLEMRRSRMARRLGDPSAAQTHRDRLLTLAGNDPRRLRRLAEAAEREGIPEIAETAWRTLAATPVEAPTALRRLRRLIDTSGDTPGAREVTRRLARIEPQDVGHRLRMAHYDVLLGERAEEALAVAEALFESQEYGLEARATGALACLRLGKPAKAEACLAGKAVRLGQLTGGQLAIGVAVHGANGREAVARELASRIPFQSLRPEERALVSPHLGPLAPVPVPVPVPVPAPGALERPGP